MMMTMTMSLNTHHLIVEQLALQCLSSIELAHLREFFAESRVTLLYTHHVLHNLYQKHRRRRPAKHMTSSVICLVDSPGSLYCTAGNKRTPPAGLVDQHGNGCIRVYTCSDSKLRRIRIIRETVTLFL